MTNSRVSVYGRIEDRLGFTDGEEISTHRGIRIGKYYLAVPKRLVYEVGYPLVVFPNNELDRKRVQELVLEQDNLFTANPSAANPSGIGTVQLTKTGDTLNIHFAQSHLASTPSTRRQPAPRRLIEKYTGWIQHTLDYLIETHKPQKVTIRKIYDPVNQSYRLNHQMKLAVEEMRKRHGFKVDEKESEITLTRNM